MDTNDLRILAIDDNRDDLTALRTVLSDALPGAGLLTALNGPDGIEAAQAEDPDVILLDILVPGMDGYAVCRNLKEDPRLHTIPVLFLTANKTDRESRVKALDAGAEGFVSKPFDEVELVAQIRAMAKVKAAGRLQRLEREQLAALVAERTRELEQELAERKRTEEHLRQIEARLRQSEKMEAVGQLAGGIAHDFNNVLGGIMGFTGMSLGHAAKGSILERNLLNILKAANRAKLLVQQILTFSRHDNPQKSVTPIQPIVKEVLELLRASVPSSVIIESDLRETKPVFADPTQIHEMLLNLATNAVHAMASKGTLTVRLHAARLDRVAYGRTGEIAPGEYVVMEVADNGCGMDEATVARACEPFFTTKAVGEGTGMGLSVVLGMVQSHDGDMQIDSVPGEGSTFRLYLPAQEEPASCSSHDDARVSVSGTERILFVDDEPMLLDMAEHVLTALGYRVTCTSSSLDALARLQQGGDEIDILVTDHTMPVMTGVELAKKALAIRADLPVILCTGYSTEIDGERAAAIGISRFVMKPYGARELGKLVREALDSKKKELGHG
jgi:signal transduction histidine kinase